MTGPLRKAVKKLGPGHERILVDALFALADQAAGVANCNEAAPQLLRPLPYLLYLADGDAGEQYNVFTAAKLAPVQKAFKKYPLADCSPPRAIVESLGLEQSHPVHLGTVLARCPHYHASMRTKWGMPKAPGEESCCVLL